VAADPNRGNSEDGLSVEIDASELTLSRLDQLTHDIAALVREVTGELTGGGKDAVQWVVEEIRRESPLRLELSPRAAKDDVPPQLVGQVASVITEGIALIEERPERPRYFNDTALDRAKDLASRIGDEVRAVRFRRRNGALSKSVTVTQRLAANVDEIIGPRLERFGTVEGRLEGVLVHRRRVFYIWETLTNRRVECTFGDRIELADVLAAFGRRVSVRGLIRTRKTGEKLSVEAGDLYVFPPEEELPTIDEVQGILRDTG
jgi:hypothetical protein